MVLPWTPVLAGDSSSAMMFLFRVIDADKELKMFAGMTLKGTGVILVGAILYIVIIPIIWSFIKLIKKDNVGFCDVSRLGFYLDIAVCIYFLCYSRFFGDSMLIRFYLGNGTGFKALKAGGGLITILIVAIIGVLIPIILDTAEKHGTSLSSAIHNLTLSAITDPNGQVEVEKNSVRQHEQKVVYNQCITMTDGNNSFEVSMFPTTVGSSREYADHYIEGNNISGCHLRLAVVEGNFAMMDISGENDCIYLNGQVIDKGEYYAVQEGDVLGIGDRNFRMGFRG